MTVKGVVQNFMECSSLNALPFIVNAENKAIKLLWIIIFTIGATAMIFHLSFVVATYLEYGTTTSITFERSNLTFPDVLICNKNTVRKSMISKLRSRKFKVFLNSFTDALTDVGKGRPIEEVANFSDPFGDNDTTWGQNIRSQMKVLYGAEPRYIRKEVGHQIEDMLRSCEFNGRSCSESDFELENTMDYGNCFFFKPRRRTVNTAGSEHGLHVKLYLQGDEFIPYLSQYGLQVLVSAPSAMKFPSDLGVFASSSFETRIALGQNNITRLDGKYGPCNSSDTELGSIEKKIYTRHACNVLCEIKYADEMCSCVLPEDMDYAKILKKEDDTRVCNITETLCVRDQKKSLRNESVTNCSDHCGNPCSETTYTLTISTQSWPDINTAESLVNDICLKNQSGCEDLKKMDYLQRRENFAAVTIFYDKMEYTSYSQGESYDLVSFVSDFGGTMGLWIGISAITVIEILYFFSRLGIVLLTCASRTHAVNVELR